MTKAISAMTLEQQFLTVFTKNSLKRSSGESLKVLFIHIWY